MAWCSQCGASVQIPLPVEPLYSLATAALLIPIKLSALKPAMKRYKHILGPPLYRWWQGTQQRLLSANDIRALRAAYVTERHARKGRPPTPGPGKRGPKPRGQGTTDATHEGA